MKAGAALALGAAMGLTLLHGQVSPEIEVRLSTPVSTVASLTMVERPDVPRESTNAAGDGVTTDGRAAAVFMAGQD